MAKNDGGRTIVHHRFPDEGGTTQFPQLVIGLRDYFAAQALAIAVHEVWTSHKFEDVAKRCYLYADAMLSQREATDGEG